MISSTTVILGKNGAIHTRKSFESQLPRVHLLLGCFLKTLIAIKYFLNKKFFLIECFHIKLSSKLQVSAPRSVSPLMSSLMETLFA